MNALETVVSANDNGPLATIFGADYSSLPVGYATGLSQVSPDSFFVSEGVSDLFVQFLKSEPSDIGRVLCAWRTCDPRAIVCLAHLCLNQTWDAGTAVALFRALREAASLMDPISNPAIVAEIVQLLLNAPPGESEADENSVALPLVSYLLRCRPFCKTGVIDRALAEVVYNSTSEYARRVALRELRAFYPNVQLSPQFGGAQVREWLRAFAQPQRIAELLVSSHSEMSHQTIWSCISGDLLSKWCIFETALRYGMVFTESSGDVLVKIVKDGAVSAQVVYNSLSAMQKYTGSNTAGQYLGYMLIHLPGEFVPIIWRPLS